MEWIQGNPASDSFLTRTQSNILKMVINRIDIGSSFSLEVNCSFSEVEKETKTQKKFVEDHVDVWIKDLLQGVSSYIVVTGTVDGGKNYLLKGSNSIPGIVPTFQKRLVQLAGDLKLSSRLSYVRYCDGLISVILVIVRGILGYACFHSLLCCLFRFI